MTEDDPRPGRLKNVRQMLHESFNMRKVYAKMVPKLYTPEQKESRMDICADILTTTLTLIQAC
ncbi:hypothetical protein NQ318_006535 [Aromia moschata]|uniref:Uncharacterized protein n=1 Tax=Aromia moschata TaxID=1265417 RepID=A0AAV8YPT1_9CUCU|nr:hypothetical protein NQ318_006535 [Aromia moschata]